MKIRLLLPLLALLPLAYLSCSKGSGTNNNPDPTPVEAKKKYLTKMVTVSTPPAASTGQPTTTTYEVEYDSKKRLSKTTSGINVSTFTYTNSGDLFSISVNSGASRTVTEFTYSDNKVKSALVSLFLNNAATSSKTYTYVYFGDKVSEIHQDIYSNKYFYDQNGNIIKVALTGSPSYDYLYTHDTSKKNKFAGAAFKFPLPNDIFGDFYSPNALISQVTSGLSTNVKFSNAYVFDADGYPISSDGSSDAKNSATTKVTYTYSTLD